MEGGYRLHSSGDGEDDFYAPGSREERRRSRIDDEVIDSRETAFELDSIRAQEDAIREAISEDEGWKSIDDVIESEYKEIDANIVSTSRDLLATLGVADAGAIHFYHDLAPLQPFIKREPQLLERVIKDVQGANLTRGRKIVTLDDLANTIKNQGIEQIQHDQTREDVELLEGIGIDKVELRKRLAVGGFREKFEVRSLARLLREGPMNKFVDVLRYEAEQKGTVDFDEAHQRAKAVINRHDRQESELAAGESRAVKRWEGRLGTMAVRKAMLRELEGYFSEVRMRNMLKNPPDEKQQ
jgi:hypothetical protein